MNGKNAIRLTVVTAILALAVWTPAAAQGGWQVLGTAGVTLGGMLLLGLWGDLAVGALIFAVCALMGTGASIASRTWTVAAGRGSRPSRRPPSREAAATSRMPARRGA